MANTRKSLRTPIRITIVVLLIGMLCRILYWPYAYEIILFSFFTLVLLYAYRFYKKENKQTIDYIKMALVAGWTTNGILNILEFPFTLLFQIITGITFISWFVMEGTAYFMDDEKNAKNSANQILWNIAIVLGAFAIILGSILHLLDWQFSTPLLTAGIAIIGSYILKDIFIKESPKKKDTTSRELPI